MQKSFMANRKALSSSRQAMNAVQPISTYEGFGTIISVLVTKPTVINITCKEVLALLYLYW